MSAREAVLRSVAAKRPVETALPELPEFPAPEGDLAGAFAENLAAAGGAAVALASRADISRDLARRLPDAGSLASMLSDVAGDIDLGAVSDPHQLSHLGILICASPLGVAESGAVWLPRSALGCDVAPFLAEHVVVLLDPSTIVWNLQQAYARLHGSAEGFGTFVAGPSKTADIEQALVVGAHGPRSLTVYLTR